MRALAALLGLLVALPAAAQPQPQTAPARTVAPDPAPGAPALAAPPMIYGAFYLGIPPSMSYGIAVAQPDRLLAHRVAESSCRGRGGQCVLQKEFNDTCVTVVEGVRRVTGAFLMTSDPSTYVVRAITLGAADNPADAERLARDACALRERGGLTCRTVHAECGPR